MKQTKSVKHLFRYNIDVGKIKLKIDILEELKWKK